jgi:hypothetical protein
MFLERISKDKIEEDCFVCVALCHNERNILAEFLEHYRKFGDVCFAIVDDGSTDGSQEFLAQQMDVTLFRPAEGTSYKNHKRLWRKELLDRYADGKWCLVPDIDEHLVYKGFENTKFVNYVEELDANGANAVHAIMVDMYSGLLLRDHLYAGGGLCEAFPYFDGPESYWIMATPREFREKFPSPSAMVYGGMRERVIFGRTLFNGWQRKVLSRICSLPFDLTALNANMLRYRIARLLYKFGSQFPDVPPLDCSKIPLLKWSSDFFFNGGAHCVNRPLRFYRHSSALLHYRFTRGMDGLSYMATRGQFAANDWYCKQTAAVASKFTQSMISKVTRRYTDSSSLEGLI